MGAGLIWGIILILFGISVIVKVVFNVNFPVIKILIALLFIYLGIKMLVGHNFKVFNLKGGANDVIFNEMSFSAPSEDKVEYNVVFGKGYFDLTGMAGQTGSKKIKVSAVFGGAVIVLPRDYPVRIKAEAIFSGVGLPGGNTAVFGTSHYQSDGFKEDSASLDLMVDAVFAGVQIEQR